MKWRCAWLFVVLSVLEGIAFAQSTERGPATFDAIQSALEDLSSWQEKRDWLKARASQVESFAPIDQARFWYLLGQAYDLSGETDPAIAAFNQVIALYAQHELPLSRWLPLAYVDRSYMIYLQTFEPDNYCPDRQKALSLARELADPQVLTQILVQTAFCYRQDATSMLEGLALLDEAISLAGKHAALQDQYPMIYNASADLYLANQIVDKAYEFTAKAYDAWLGRGEEREVFNMLYTLVGLAIEQADSDAASAHVAQMFALADAHPEHPDFVFFAHLSQARVSASKGEWSQVAADADSALKNEQKTQERYFVFEAMRWRVVASFRLEQFDKALDILTQLKQGRPEHLKRFPELRAIDAFFNRNTGQAMQHMFASLDLIQTRKRNGVRNTMLANTRQYSESLMAMDNTLLQQRLEINRLQLEEEQNQRKIALLSLVVLVLVFAGALVFIRHLLKTRGEYRRGAQTDYLTGLANRRYIMERGNNLVLQSNLHEHPLSLLVFDIDHFKQVNDQHGHEMGDKALRKVSQQAQACLRSQDEIGRIGGEEFLVLLPNTDGDTAMQVAERIRQRIAHQHLRHGEKSLPLSISTGVAAYQKDETLQDAINRADKALYKAKQRGRNCCVAAGTV